MATSRALPPILALVGLQLVAGVVGLAVVSGGSEDPSGQFTITQPGEPTTTSPLAGLGDLRPGLSSDAATTVPPSSDTTVGGVGTGTPVTTTARAATTTTSAATTTTRPLPAKAPGGQAVLKVGAYNYDVTTTDPDGQTQTSSTTAQVTDGGAAGGVARRLVKDEAGGFGNGTNTVAFPGTALSVERSVIEVQGSTFDCVWQPAFPQYVAPMKLGTAWSFTTSCTGTFRGGDLDGSQARIDNRGSFKVTGSETRALGPATYGTWIITGSSEVDVTFTSGLASGQKLMTKSDGTDSYSPELSIPMASDKRFTFTAFGQSRTGRGVSRLTKAP